jgi:DtxR family Mn-dependent transcriptional regulator
MIGFMKFLQICPRGGDDLLNGFAVFCEKGKSEADCADCLSSCVDDAAQKP